MLQLLLPAAGCGLMMAACAFLMRRHDQPSPSFAAEDDVVALRAEVASLRNQLETPHESATT